MRRPLAVLAFVLVVAPAAWGSEERPTLAELEGELICPTCETTLDQSSSPIATRMRGEIRRRIAAGESKSEIKDALVEEFGEGVLAAPPKEGFGLLAWLVPLAGLVGAALALGLLVLRWSRRRGRDTGEAPELNGRAPLDPELERRLDQELARLE